MNARERTRPRQSLGYRDATSTARPSSAALRTGHFPKPEGPGNISWRVDRRPAYQQQQGDWATGRFLVDKDDTSLYFFLTIARAIVTGIW